MWEHNFKNILILGSDSGIWKMIEKKIICNFENIIYFKRGNKIKKNYNKNNNVKYIYGDISKKATLDRLDSLGLEGKSLVLNFAGVYGKPKLWQKDNFDNIENNWSKNFNTYWSGITLLLNMQPHSTLIGFAGSGVGGIDIDFTNVGYLASKSSIVLVNQALSDEFEKLKLYSILISPGAYPTKMQEIVAKSNSKVAKKMKIAEAKENMLVTPNTKKLIECLEIIANKPVVFNGKLVSAKFDNFEDYFNNPKIGKMFRSHDK